MKKTTIATITIIALIFTCSYAFAGPFGFEFGSQINTYHQPHEQLKPFVYKFRKAPHNNPDIEFYYVFASKKHGITMIKAVTYDIDTNSYGIQLKSKYNDIAAVLDAKYGSHRDVEMLLPDSIWDDNDEFMMSLMKKDRCHSKLWEPNQNDGDDNSIETISISAKPLSQNKGYILIEYASFRWHAYKKDTDKSKNSTF